MVVFHENSFIASTYLVWKGRSKRVKSLENRATRQHKRVRDGAERLVKFLSQKPTYIHYANMTSLAQGVIHFLELKGCIYPSLIREFYANFQYKNGDYLRGKLIVLDEEIFLVVGGLASSVAPLGDYNNDKWSDFDSTEMYKSCLRGPHYLIVYILVQCNTNQAQPTVNDLKLMFPIREGILVNWPSDILKVIDGIAKSSSRLLAYGIFISRVIDHLDIDTSYVEKLAVNSREHLVSDNLIHKMSIYKHGSEWMYQKFLKKERMIQKVSQERCERLNQ
ncbi:hypothetical protein Lal_00015831 [Lupinus albus]|nr:hypothetical protein Lal_00015831 [Lupinus albus]